MVQNEIKVYVVLTLMGAIVPPENSFLSPERVLKLKILRVKIVINYSVK